MPRSRKSFEVRDFKNFLDKITANENITADERELAGVILSRVLLDSNNYRGFRYLDGNNGRTDGSLRHYF